MDNIVFGAMQIVQYSPLLHLDSMCNHQLHITILFANLILCRLISLEFSFLHLAIL